MRKAALLLALLLGFVGAFACDCGNWPLDSALARANVVFSGLCMDVTTNPIKGDYNVLFRVDSSWKRQIEHTVTIHTPHTDCGFDFQKGLHYLVVADKRHQTLHTDVCRHTVAFTDSLPPQIVALGKAFQPGRPEFANKMNLILAGLGVLSLLLVAVVVLRKRFRPAPQGGK